MDNNIMLILIIAYTAWAIYSGYKMISGRSQWLDTREPLNVIIKIILSIIVGYVIGAFYLIYLILKMIGLFSKI